MTPSDYEMVEQGYDPPRMTPTLEDENRALREALRELRDYAASVWFDEATATDEERELMDRTRRALAAEALAAEPASGEAMGCDDWIHEIIGRYQDGDIDVHSAMREIERGLAPSKP